MRTRPKNSAGVAAVALAMLVPALPAEAVSSAEAVNSTALAPSYRAKANLAVTWQASQLKQGRIRTSGFDDWGLTIDTAFALAAEGKHPVRLARVTKAITNNYFNTYATYAGDKYAGAMSKSLLAAKVLGKRARHFGGHNVRRQVLSLIAPAGAGFEAGRVRDTGETDYSNTLSQSYAVLGLARTGGVPRRAVRYLVKQQCAPGYFRTFEIANRTCDASSSKPDVDATALAVQALVAARASGRTIPDRAIVRASRWLRSAQQPNGGFRGGPATSGINTNSTGLAVQALAATGRLKARGRAASYVAKLQITRPRAGAGPARKDLGAIAYDRASFSAAIRSGITADTRGIFRRATPQAVFAFVPKPLTTLLVRK